MAFLQNIEVTTFPVVSQAVLQLPISIFLFHSNGHRDHNGVLFLNGSILLRMEVKFQFDSSGKGFKSNFVLGFFCLSPNIFQ
jgi:hypothetical protein